MLICRNAEGVHGQRKVGNLWLRALMRFSVHSTLSRNFFHPTNKLTCLLSWEAIRGLHARGGRSHFFRLRLRSCSKIFESGSGNISNFSIWLLFTLRLPSIQPKSTHVFSLEMTAQTPVAAEIEKWLRIRCQAKFLTRYCLSVILRFRVKEESLTIAFFDVRCVSW